jgi:hypothetical protein
MPRELFQKLNLHGTHKKQKVERIHRHREALRELRETLMAGLREG